MTKSQILSDSLEKTIQISLFLFIGIGMICDSIPQSWIELKPLKTLVRLQESTDNLFWIKTLSVYAQFIYSTL